MRAHTTPTPSFLNVGLIPINLSSNHSSANPVGGVCKDLNGCTEHPMETWGKAWDPQSKGKHPI